MKTHLNSLFTPLFLLAFALVSCGQDSKTPESTAPVAGTQQSMPTWYAVRVDKLLLRDNPTQVNSQILQKLPEGSFVVGTGHVSSKKEEATIRGILQEAPFIRVYPLGQTDKASGWAFGGGLLPLYTGSADKAPDFQSLTPFAAFLKSLPPAKLESGAQAWTHVRNNLTVANGATADAAFILFEHFLHNLEVEGNFYTLTEKMPWTEADLEAIYKDNLDMNRYPVTKKLAASGFRLETAEGTVFPIFDWSQLTAHFENKVTPPMRTFLRQQLEEQREQAFSDGGIILPLETMVERAIFWEKFNRENPLFPLKDETRESEKWMRMVMVNGADNTPVFDYETKKVNAEFEKAWNMLLSKYPGTQLAKTVGEMKALIQAEGGQLTPKVEAFRNKVAEEYNH